MSPDTDVGPMPSRHTTTLIFVFVYCDRFLISHYQDHASLRHREYTVSPFTSLAAMELFDFASLVIICHTLLLCMLYSAHNISFIKKRSTIFLMNQVYTFVNLFSLFQTYSFSSYTFIYHISGCYNFLSM